MPTRSIKLKIALGHDETLRDVRRAIWTTHEVFNEGVRYYMTWLMRMRQQPLDDPDAPKDDILPLAREAQQRNNRPDQPGSDDDIRRLLRSLYEEIVPSAAGKSGDANQIGRAYLSVLVDPTSVGGMGESASGRKPAWMSMPPGPERDAKKQAWEQRRSESLEQSARRPLKNLGVLPLFEPYSKTLASWTRNVARARDTFGVTTWDRDMFQQALERLMSWESWNRRVEQELQQKRAKFSDLCSRYLDPVPDWHRRLREYENARKSTLDAVALASEREFRITPRMIRGWERLREKWLGIPKSQRDETQLRKIIAELQTELRGRFGDASDLFPWLAKPENHWLWDETSPAHVLQTHVGLNEAERAVEDAREFANYTPPESILHPLWARSDVPGGSNFHDYSLTVEDGKMKATLRLLSRTPDGAGVVERDMTVTLRPSGQWNRPQRGKRQPLIEIVPVASVPKSMLTGKKNDIECTWVRVTDAGTASVLYGTLG